MANIRALLHLIPAEVIPSCPVFMIKVPLFVVLEVFLSYVQLCVQLYSVIFA